MIGAIPGADALASLPSITGGEATSSNGDAVVDAAASFGGINYNASNTAAWAIAASVALLGAMLVLRK